MARVGRLVMYTFNWDAGYSTDGGQSFFELDPHTTFPSDHGGFCCDQVVIYDPSTKRLIWVLQYNGGTKENVIRVAFTSPNKLATYGARAWSWFDLPSGTLAGAGHFLDQPKLGLTDRYLYMNINQSDSSGVHKTVIARIPRAGFANPGSLGYGYAVLDPWSLRVAQHVSGQTEYFVGHKDTSTLRVASVDDDSNYVLTQDLKDQTIADHNWVMRTPGGDDMMRRQSDSQGSQVTGVTQDGNANLWATWSEGRDVVGADGTVVHRAGMPTQPAIGAAVLTVNHPHTGPPPVIALHQHLSYWNPNFAIAMPDLATAANGEVAIVFDYGGGTEYLDHAVGFLSGGLDYVTVQASNSDPIWAGNPAGDYQTVRPDAAPHGDCLLAAGDVNQGTHVGYPTLTIFSRKGVTCPTLFRTPPAAPPPTGNAPATEGTTLTLSCPSSTNAGQSYPISGSLAPPLNGAPITITYTSTDPGSTPATHTVSTGSAGTFNDTGPGAPAGTETVRAKYPGDATHDPSEQTCQVTIQPVIG